MICLVLENTRERKKIVKKTNGFFIFGFTIKNIKENQIYLKLIYNLYNFKLFNLVIIDK